MPSPPGYYLIHGLLAADSPERLIGRYLTRLIQVAGDSAGTVGAEIQITQEELGAATGLRRETVSKHLRALQQPGILVLRRGRLTILDPGQLAE